MTKKVLERFPKDKADFRPRPYWNSPLQLLISLGLTEQKVRKGIEESQWDAEILPPLITHWEEAIHYCEEVRNATLAFAERLEEQQWGTPVQSPKGKQFTLMDFFFDLGEFEAYIRGQLIVYGRLAGGHIPEPYGD